MSERDIRLDKDFQEYRGYSNINSYLNQFKINITPVTPSGEGKLDYNPDLVEPGASQQITPKEIKDYQYLRNKYNDKEFSLAEDTKIPIANTGLFWKITDPYKIRNWKGDQRNKQHSTGMDYTVIDADGKKLDGAYAVADGVIESVNFQVTREWKKDEKTGEYLRDKNGNKIKGKVVDDGSNPRLLWGNDYAPSGGVFVIVKHNDGTYGQYMHLDKIKDKKSLINKPIKRGDKIGNYLSGSGTGSGSHVKYRVFTNPKLRSKTHIDPSAYFLDLINSTGKITIKENSFKIPSEISQEALNNLKVSEGRAGSNGKPALTVYELKNNSGKSDGHLTVGWGHAESKDSTDLKKGQRITQKQAEAYLKEDVSNMQTYLNNYFDALEKKNIKFNINQQMYDALFDFMYNIGPGNFEESEVFNHIKKGEYKIAGEKLATTWITFEGHKPRRQKESNLFLEGLGLLILPSEKEKEENKNRFKKGNLDYYINQLFDFESTSGTSTGGGHTNFGYNTTGITASNKQQAFNIFYKNYMPIYSNSDLNWVTNIEKIRLYDFNFNSGRDLRGYAVNEYFKEKFNSEFENRYYNKNAKIRENFTEEQHEKAKAAQKQDLINKFNQYIKPLSLKDRLRLFDNARQYYYAYIDAPDAKNAYFNSWKKRLELYGGFKGDDIDKLDSFRK